MKRRWIAASLALFLIFALGSSAFAASYDGSVNVDNIVEGGKKMYANFEGGYDNVVPSDSGAVGLGILGWRACKALELLQIACKKAPSYAQSVLGNSFYSEIMNTSCSYPAWSSRTLNSTEAAACKILISSSYGVAAQNELARTDITRQIGEAWNQGIRSDAAILYYCSVSNHYGPGGAQTFMTYVRQALGISSSSTITSLEQLHSGVVSAASLPGNNVASTLSYRTKIYNYIKYTLGWSTTGGGSTPVSPLQPPSGGGGSPVGGVQIGSYYYTDVSPTSWALSGIRYVVEQGLFQGTSNSTFSPSMSMNRAMAVTVLYRMRGATRDMWVGSETGGVFVDVPTASYYYDAVYWANRVGIVNGMTATTFEPERSLTREQLATLLYRYAEYTGKLGTVDRSAWSLHQFTDGSKTHNYAKIAMAWAIDKGLIKGVGTNGGTLLDPQGEATRAQVAVIIMRFLQMN